MKFISKFLSNIFLNATNIVVVVTLPIEWILLVLLSGHLLADLVNGRELRGFNVLKPVVYVSAGIAIAVHVVCLSELLEGLPLYILFYTRNQLLALALVACFLYLIDFFIIDHLCVLYSSSIICNCSVRDND